jgi:endonuclease V-like protein UPF0215 family
MWETNQIYDKADFGKTKLPLISYISHQPHVEAVGSAERVA